MRHIPLLSLTVLALFPLYFMVSASLKTKADYISNKIGIPHHFSMENYIEVFGHGTFLIWFRNSILLTVGAVVLSMLLSVMAAYAIAKFSFPGKAMILKIIVALMVLPPVVMLIPLFRMMAGIGLLNTYSGVIIIYTGLVMPFSVFLLTNFFRSVPNEIIESAQIDGCGRMRILYSIILPLSLPAFLTLVIVNSLWVWNELLISVVFLQDDKMKTLMVGLTAFKSRYNLNIPVTMAGLVISTLPIAILYIAAQRFFIEGLTAGATKG